jgi:protein gp37
MGEKSNISWTESSWNPVTGCSKVSEGCRYCYAETLSLRMGWSDAAWTFPNAARNVVLHPDRLELPLKWRKPRMIFVNSMSDVFHEQVPDEYIERMFAVMALAPQHTFQVLTKRPERMREWVTGGDPLESREIAVGRMAEHLGKIVWDARGSDPSHYSRAITAEQAKLRRVWPGWPLPNVWLGTSVEDQRAADERIPHLLNTPAAVRFLSCEPLLGPLDLHRYLWEAAGPEWAGENPSPDLGWVIVGGESGSHLTSADQDDRWMDPAWARDIRDQCVAAGTPFFMKQHSAKRPGQMPYIIEADHSHTEWHQFPEGVTA